MIGLLAKSRAEVMMRWVACCENLVGSLLAFKDCIRMKYFVRIEVIHDLVVYNMYVNKLSLRIVLPG